MKHLIWAASVLLLISCSGSRIGSARKKDIEVITTKGTIVLRLSDSTPLHRDNFLRLVKTHFYDSVLFHRVIKNFMIQAGDPVSRRATDSTDLGDHDTTYKIPAEFRQGLF